MIAAMAGGCVLACWEDEFVGLTSSLTSRGWGLLHNATDEVEGGIRASARLAAR